MGIIDRLRLRWATRGSVAAPISTTAIPTEQREQLTADQKWAQEHGFSAAFPSMPDTVETAAHNKAIDDEYRDEVKLRKDAWISGEYQPRFFVVESDNYCRLKPSDIESLRLSASVDSVNWDLEMSMLPGRRTDVTHERAKQLETVTPDHVAGQMAIDAAGRSLTDAELGRRETPRTVRDLVGSRATILRLVGGDAEKADAIERKALELLGAESMDAPIPVPGGVI